MSGERVKHRLAAILAADVAGYSRLMGQDEAGTLARLRTHRRELIDPKIAEHRGRIVKTTGDGMLVEFPSVVEAVACAVAIQRGMAERNAAIPNNERIEFRVGVNLGDVIAEDGDGVNIAARLEALAEPGGVCVSGVVHDQVQGRLECRFENTGEQKLKNIARPVRVYRVRDASVMTRPSPVQTVLPLPDKPSLAVLPFLNMTGDPEQEYFVDGMVEEIMTAISRLPWLFVIARNSSFAYKGKAVDVKQVARELGVRYVLEGSVRKAGNRVRITGQLIDTATGAHLLADRFDGALDDIFDLQDEVASSVVGAIEPKLRSAETERAIRKPTQSLDAHDLYLRALAKLHQFTNDGFGEAVILVKQALAINPTYAPAAAMLGWCRVNQSAQGLALHPAEVAESTQLARRAIEAGTDDPDTLWMSGWTIAVLAGEHSAAASAIERSLALNPNSAHAWMARGFVSCYRNLPGPAIEAFNRAMRLSPLDPFGSGFAGGIALAYMIGGRYEEAIESADRCLHERASHAMALRIRVASCAHLGRLPEAQQWLARLLKVAPGLTISWVKAYATTFLPPETVAVYLEDLRKAGLPEE
jgi:adenylate cyclase